VREGQFIMDMHTHFLPNDTRIHDFRSTMRTRWQTPAGTRSSHASQPHREDVRDNSTKRVVAGQRHQPSR